MGTIKIKNAEGNWIKLPNYGVQNFPEAPVDNKTYGRKNSQWVEFKGGDDKVYLNNLASTVDANRIIFSFTFSTLLMEKEYETIKSATTEELEGILGCTIQEFNNTILTKVDSETSFVFPILMEEENMKQCACLSGSLRMFSKQDNQYTLYISIFDGESYVLATFNNFYSNESKQLEIDLIDQKPIESPYTNEISDDFSKIFDCYPWFYCYSNTGGNGWKSFYDAHVKLHYRWLKPTFFELTAESTDEEIKNALGEYHGFKYFGYFGTFESSTYTGNSIIIKNRYVDTLNSRSFYVVYVDYVSDPTRTTTVSFIIDQAKDTSVFSIRAYNKIISPKTFVNITEPTNEEGIDGDIWIQYVE